MIGHEMAHIRNCDIRLTTMVTMMFGGFGVFSGRFISILLSREREYLADATAVEFTRNPTALIRALEHIAKTESPLRCATEGTAQLFIVDPFERADAGRSYKQFIDEVTGSDRSPAKQRSSAPKRPRNFAAHGYPRNFVVQAVSSHPPLRERIARLQALLGAPPKAARRFRGNRRRATSEICGKRQIVGIWRRPHPAVGAEIMQAALLALPAGRRLLEENSELNLSENRLRATRSRKSFTNQTWPPRAI